MLRNRYGELISKRAQLLAEISAFNILAEVYGIEPIPDGDTTKSSVIKEEMKKELFFSSLSEAKNYLGSNGFKSLGTHSYSKGPIVASIDYEYESGKWKVSFQ